MRARGDRAPHVLADLDAERKLFSRAEQQIGSEGDLRLSGEIDGRLRDSPSGGKMALFIKFAVIREIGLRHDAADASVPDDKRGVEESSVETDRCAKDEDHGKPGGFPCDLRDGVFRRVQKRLVMKQIAAGVGAHGKFRKQGNACGVRTRLVRERKNVFCIERGVRHLHHGRTGCDSVKTEHETASPFVPGSALCATGVLESPEECAGIVPDGISLFFISRGRSG